MSTNINISQTPLAPYLSLLSGMNRNEKIAVVLYLIDSLPGVEIVETTNEETMSPEDEAFLAMRSDSHKQQTRLLGILHNSHLHIERVPF